MASKTRATGTVEIGPAHHAPPSGAPRQETKATANKGNGSIKPGKARHFAGGSSEFRVGR